MKCFRLCLMLSLGLALLAQGCGRKPPEEPAAKEDRSAQVISRLEADLVQARDDLSRERGNRDALAKEIVGLKGEIQELEAKVAQQEAQEPAPPPEPPAQPEEGVPPGTRVGLLGAKAIAEFRAQQLSQRLDKLTKDLETKETELNSIRENAQQKEAEVARLSETLDRLHTADQLRAEEVNAKLASMSKELAIRSEESKRFKQELDEKAGLLDTLKQAVADAAKLKTNCEAEGEKLRAALATNTAKLKKAERQIEDAVKEIQQYQTGEDDMRRQMAEWRDAAERSRAQAESSGQESEQLKAEIAQLMQRLQSAQPKGAEEPSAVDQILQSPVSGATPAKQPLY
jgi:chromosome segregation ATPase